MPAVFLIMLHEDFDQIFHGPGPAPRKYQALVELFSGQVLQGFYHPGVTGYEFAAAVGEVKRLARRNGLGIIDINAARRALRHRLVFGMSLQRLHDGIVPAGDMINIFLDRPVRINLFVNGRLIHQGSELPARRFKLLDQCLARIEHD